MTSLSRLRLQARQEWLLDGSEAEPSASSPTLPTGRNAIWLVQRA